MARPYRLQNEGLLYHITSRGDDRKKIFTSDRDFEKFLEYLKLAQNKFRFFIYSYCLMGNHYHLLLETTQPNLSSIMQYINTAYTVYYNRKQKRCGHLFQGRYKSIVVDRDSYLLELTRYIHLNPVRAGAVDFPEKYKWSSCKDFINDTKATCLDKHKLDEYLTMSPKSYKQFLYEGIGKDINPLDNVSAGFMLGSEDFTRNITTKLKENMKCKDFTHRKIACGVDHKSIIAAVAKMYHVQPEILFKSIKKSLLAKKVAVHLLKRYSGLTNTAIGEIFGVTYSAVSKIDKDVQRLAVVDKGLKNNIEIIISHFKV